MSATEGEKIIKNTNIWRLNNMLLNNQHHRRNQNRNQNMHRDETNENTTTQNLWDSVKAVLRGMFIAVQAYLKKQEKSQINNLALHIK